MAKLGSGRSHRPQGRMLPVLLLLLASVEAVPVMADGEEQLIGVAEKVVVAALGKIKGWEDFAKGVKWGSKTYKIVHKADEGLEKILNPGPGGGMATTLLDAVQVIPALPPPLGVPSPMLPVLTADITATISVRTGFCAAESATTTQAVGLGGCSITLYGHWGAQSRPPLTLVGTLHMCASPSPPELAVLGLGRGGDLSRRFPTFSYLVTSQATTVLLLPTTTASQPPPPVGRPTIPLSVSTKYPERYYVGIAGIRVGGQVVVQTTPELSLWPDGTGGVYLSTTEPYTYLESGVHFRLKLELIRQIRQLNPGPLSPLGNTASSQLCYVSVGTKLMVPSMEILFANSNSNAAAVMKLGVANVWYRDGPSTVCLAILPTNNPGQASVLGSRLQSGRVMTIDLTPRAGALAGTLTFSS